MTSGWEQWAWALPTAAEQGVFSISSCRSICCFLGQPEIYFLKYAYTLLVHSHCVKTARDTIDVVSTPPFEAHKFNFPFALNLPFSLSLQTRN